MGDQEKQQELMDEMACALEALAKNSIRMCEIHLRDAIVLLANLTGLDMPSCAAQEPREVKPTVAPSPHTESPRGVADLEPISKAIKEFSKSRTEYQYISVDEQVPGTEEYTTIGKFWVRTGWERTYRGDKCALLLDIERTFKLRANPDHYLGLTFGERKEMSALEMIFPAL